MESTVLSTRRTLCGMRHSFHLLTGREVLLSPPAYLGTLLKQPAVVSAWPIVLFDHIAHEVCADIFPFIMFICL